MTGIILKERHEKMGNSLACLELNSVILTLVIYPRKEMERKKKKKAYLESVC